MAVQIETVKVEDLTPHPKNYRDHPDDQIEHLMHSIKENGFYRNIVVASDLTILAGHGTVKAAERMGMTEVPAIRLNIASDDPKALKILAGDNEVGRLAMNDDRALSELLKEINEVDVDGLIGTGFDESQLAALVMVTRPAEEIADFDAAAEWAGAGMPEYDAGQTDKDIFTIVVRCNTEEDANDFIAKAGINILRRQNKTWSSRWPDDEQENLIANKWDEAE